MRVVSVSGGGYKVKDVDDNTVEYLSPDELIIAMSVGVYVEGCLFTRNGLLTEIDMIEHSIDGVDIPEVWKKVTSEYNFRRRDGSFKYEVSNLGRVRVAGYVGCRGAVNPHVMCQYIDRAGYYVVHFTDEQHKKHSFYVHRLVACAFVHNVRGVDLVNHLNENKLCNVAYNLEWCTHRENITYGTAVRRAASKRSRAVRQYTLDGKLVSEFVSTAEAANIVGVDSSRIQLCCKRRSGCVTCKGYFWRYADDDDIAIGNVPDKPVCRQHTVRQYSLDGTLLNEFDSVAMACKAIGIAVDGCGIYHCCERFPGSFTCRGFMWRYSDDDELYEKAMKGGN